MAASNVSIKLLMDKKGRRVLFAEAGKDFVDFLFSMLSLPIATVIRLLTNSNTDMAGGCSSLANLYHSVEDLKDEYIQPNTNPKETLLKPKSSTSVPLLHLKDAPPSVPPYVATAFYKCSNCEKMSSGNRTCCSYSSTTKVTYYIPGDAPAPAPAGDEKGGFVKGVVTYMVMDDLTVTPMSTISAITLLNKFNIKEVSDLEEKVVEIGIDQGLALLKNALTSKRVLTDVFLE